MCKPRSCNRSSARPWRSRCPGPSKWPSFRDWLAACLTRCARDGVCDFQERHAQLKQRVLKQAFFRFGEIAFGLVFENAECVDGLARADDVGLRIFALAVHDSELQHRCDVERLHQPIKGHFKIFGFAVTTGREHVIELLIRRAILVVLRLLFSMRRRRRHLLLGGGSGSLSRLRCLWFRLCLFANVSTQLAFFRELATVANDKIRFLFRHTFRLLSKLETLPLWLRLLNK